MKELTLLASLLLASSLAQNLSAAEPLKVIQVAGGCCHGYAEQTSLMASALETKFACSVDSFVDGSSREHLHSKLQQENWADGYDVVLLSLCFGHVKDDDFILSIVAEAAEGNKGLVFIHCSLHNFRSTEEGTQAWRSLMGVTSIGHEKRTAVVYESTLPDHPIMKGFPEVTEFDGEEVYKIVKVEPGVKELARAYGTETEAYHTAVWTYEYGDNRVFGTSIGHSTSSYGREEFLELVSRGVLWTAGKL